MLSVYTALQDSHWGNMPALLTTHRLSALSRLTSRLDCKHTPVKGNKSVTLVYIVFVLVYHNLYFLGAHMLRLAFEGGSTHHILFHSAHCSFHRWLISCLNSHQTQHAISLSINSPELMNTIAAFLNKKPPHIRAYLQRPGDSWNMGSKQLYSLIIKNKPKMDTLHILECTQWWRHCEDIPSGWLLLCL